MGDESRLPRAEDLKSGRWNRMVEAKHASEPSHQQGMVRRSIMRWWAVFCFKHVACQSRFEQV